MTTLELAATATAALASAFAAFQSWRIRRLLAAARRVTDMGLQARAGLRFVAEGRARPLDPQFAGALLDGNDFALRRDFPTWSAFRDHERERDIDLEFEAND